MFEGPLSPGAALIVKYISKFERSCFESSNRWHYIYFIDSKSQRASQLHYCLISYCNACLTGVEITPHFGTAETVT